MPPRFVVCMTSLAALSVIPSGAAAATGKPLKFCFMFLGQRLNFPHFLTIAVHYTLHAQCLQATLVISAGRELPTTAQSGGPCARSTNALTYPFAVHACRYGHFIGRRGIQSQFRDDITTDYKINIPEPPFGATPEQVLASDAYKQCVQFASGDCDVVIGCATLVRFIIRGDCSKFARPAGAPTATWTLWWSVQSGFRPKSSFTSRDTRRQTP